MCLTKSFHSYYHKCFYFTPQKQAQTTRNLFFTTELIVCAFLKYKIFKIPCKAWLNNVFPHCFPCRHILIDIFLFLKFTGEY